MLLKRVSTDTCFNCKCSVVKTKENRLQAVSHVFKITDLEFEGDQNAADGTADSDTKQQQPRLFPTDHPMNVQYVLVDPYVRKIKVLYHAETDYLS